MNTLRGWITTIFLVAALALSATPANAGIIFGGNSTDHGSTCSDSPKEVTVTSDDLGGIIFGGLTGLISDFTGIIFGGSSAVEPVQNCGIIYGG